MAHGRAARLQGLPCARPHPPIQSAFGVGQTTFAECAETWLNVQVELARGGVIRTNTLTRFESALHAHLIPSLGGFESRTWISHGESFTSSGACSVLIGCCPWSSGLAHRTAQPRSDQFPSGRHAGSRRCATERAPRSQAQLRRVTADHQGRDPHAGDTAGGRAYDQKPVILASRSLNPMTSTPLDSDRFAAAKRRARDVLDDRLLRVASIAGGIYIACYLILTLTLPETSLAAKLVVDVVYLVPETAAVVTLTLAARRSVRASSFWYMAALAVAFTLVGDVNWAVYDLVLGKPPSPSAGDLAYTAAPIILVVTFLLAFRRLRPRLRDVPDLVIPLAAVTFAVYHLVVAPQLDAGLSAVTIPSVTQSLAYVAAALLGTWIVSGHRRLPVALHLFYWSVVALAVSYPLYAYAVSVSSWQRVNWIYTGWQLAFVLATLAGLCVLRLGEPAQPPVAVESDVNATLLSGGLALVLGSIAISSHAGRIHPAALLIASLTVLIVTVRLHQIVRQRSRLAADLAASLAQQNRLATTDPITDIPNKRAFDHVLRAVISAAAQTGDQVGLLALDLDNFRRINDGYGRLVGDELLRLVAKRLHGAIRAQDTLARIGGEEFAVLSPRVDESALVELAERCRVTIACEPFHLEAHTIRLTSAIGAAVYPADARDPEVLLQIAFRALTQAKQHGGDRVHAGPRGVHIRCLPVPDTTAYRMLESLADQLDAEQAEQEHSLAMLDLAGQLADRLHLSTDQRRRCLLAARFHDVGKVGIPARILTKPGRLSDAEWEVMREHVRIGVELLARCAETRDIAAIVGQHHERPDGHGYPNALTGEQIVIEAAIISTADSWTAMLADRAYHGAMSREQAKAELVAGRGSQFHPDVVDALLELVDEEDAQCAA
jgi:two-component system, cell cycle response regulator